MAKPWSKDPDYQYDAMRADEDDAERARVAEEAKKPEPTHDATCECVVCAMANREIALLERVIS